MRKLWWVGLGILALAVTGMAADKAEADKPAKEGKEAVAEPLKEMTLTGKVEKRENMKKDGTPMMTWFMLVGEDGVETHLPKGKVEEFVGAKVTITGMGMDTVKRGKPARRIETVTAIEKAADGK